MVELLKGRKTLLEYLNTRDTSVFNKGKHLLPTMLQKRLLLPSRSHLRGAALMLLPCMRLVYATLWLLGTAFTSENVNSSIASVHAKSFACLTVMLQVSSCRKFIDKQPLRSLCCFRKPGPHGVSRRIWCRKTASLS